MEGRIFPTAFQGGTPTGSLLGSDCKWAILVKRSVTNCHSNQEFIPM
jgi:hypothetical protein